MDALVPESAAVASRLEREAAWASLLDPSRRQSFTALVPEIVPLDTADACFGVAARLCAVCDQLAEAGCDPSSPELPQLLEEDALRWDAFGKLYSKYLELLDGTLRDPNDVRLEQAKDPSVASALKRVVVACIPDLPVVVETYLESLAKKGIAVDVLEWSPSGQSAHLNRWGRPYDKNNKEPVLLKWWKEHPPRVPEECLVPANDPATEAGLLLDYAGSRRDVGYELFAAAPESAVALAQEIAWRGTHPYLPEGRALAQTESAEILLGWDGFACGCGLRDLRVLLQKPCFLSFFVASAGKPGHFTAEAALEACDRLVGERLCENLEAADSWLKHAEKPTGKKALREFIAQEDLVHTAFRLLGRKLDGQTVLAEVNDYRGTVAAGSPAAKELAAVAEVTDQIKNSPILGGLSAEMREAAVRADIARKRIFLRAPADAIEVQGWLEAPWSGAHTLIVAGCREGALPSGGHDDSFLPDGAKARLGLVTQDARFARDAYLLSCLLASRQPGQVLLGFARFRNQGEPNRPSRLLFGCEDRELPRRSTLLFKPAPPSRREGHGEKKFTLHIPKPAPRQWPVDSIRVTGFKSYLECPLRFYLGNVLSLRKVDADAREIPATDFGTVIHKVLEEFARDKALRDPEEIAAMLSCRLDEVIPRYYGEKPTPVIRVQIESMRSRLQAAAAAEAKIRGDGWETIAAEHKVKKEDRRMLGGLAITGTLDRIDRHPEHGLRILDYKTYSQRKNPAKTHIGPRRTSKHLPEADLDTLSKGGKVQPRSWSDLQLPLYDWLARQIWPEDAAKGVGVGYFLLPPEADPKNDALEIFALDGDMRGSAVKCATRIAELVKGGVFWPPSSRVEFDDFENWFMEGDPEKIIDAESAQRLNGNP